MLGISAGDSRGGYVPKECPQIKASRGDDGTFTVWFSGLEIAYHWSQFRLWWPSAPDPNTVTSPPNVRRNGG